MSNEKTKQVAPRWKPGGQRYSTKDAAVLAKARPADGWRNGARVSKK